MDRFFQSFTPILIDFRLVLFPMGQTARAADTTVNACHSFDEICVQRIPAFLQQCSSAFLNSVACAGFQNKLPVQSLLFQAFRNRIGKSSAPRENAAEIRRIVQYIFFQLRNIDVFAVKERLQLCAQLFRQHRGAD